MRDVLDELLTRWRRGQRVGLATIVRTWRSAPRPPGAAMTVDASGQVTGSVSGGCVEGAVYELARAALAGADPVLERYGVSDGDALAVGLSCGGIIDVFVEAVDRRSFPELGELAQAVVAGEPVALATVVASPGRPGSHLLVRPDTTTGSLGLPRLDDAVADDVRGLLAAGTTGVRTYGPHGERLGEGLQVLVQSFAPAPRMLVFGAIDFAAAVASAGAFLGYRVTVCDARGTFATLRRFPDADEVVVRWPHDYLAEEVAAGRVDERSVLCVLTHDPKFDVPLLEVALSCPAGYVGAMGSRRTHEDRLARLRERGVPEVALARLRSPIGLDLGARTPEETAISVAAELVAHRWGGSGRHLSDTAGPIHPGAPR